MFAGSISNNKLHCCLFVLILFLVIFLSVPLKLISLANENNMDNLRTERFEERGEWLDYNCTKFAEINNYTYVNETTGTCNEGSFHCARSCKEVCLPRKKLCDEQYHCPDQSDENGLDCFDFYGQAEPIFNEMLKLAKTRPVKQFAVPESCDMQRMYDQKCPCNTLDSRVIICDHANWLYIPSGVKDSVYKLQMRDNNITSITNVSWPSSLKSLVLEFNHVQRLENNTFAKCSNLVTLYLNDNDISFIDSDAFLGATSVTRIDLHVNKISHLDLRIFENTPELTDLDLSSNNIKHVDHMRFSQLAMLVDLNLNHNAIEHIGAHTFSYMGQLNSLGLENNSIASIADYAFVNDSLLNQLKLGHNKLHQIRRYMFAGLAQMKRLELAGNPMRTIRDDAFLELSGLKSLNLSYVPLEGVNQSCFAHLDLRFIYFAKFSDCFYAGKARVCRPHTDGISTDSNLIFAKFRLYVWAMACVCSLGNLFVFAWRSPNEDKSLSLIVRNLSVADLMMGLYLAALCWQNERFNLAASEPNANGNQTFRMKAYDWINSPECTAMGFLAILSSELSLITIFIITIERYRAIMSHRNLDQFELLHRARYLIAIAWCTAITIALIPLIGWLPRDKVHIYGNNGLCLPLYIDNPFNKGWQYSAIVYLGLDFTAVMIILGLYMHLYLTLMSNRKKTRPANTQISNEHVTLAFRFLFIVVADCFCWIPIVVIKFLALLKYEISHDIYVWIVVFILPINSALNPIIYTIGTPNYLSTMTFNKINDFFQSVDSLIYGWQLKRNSTCNHQDNEHANKKRSLQSRGSSSHSTTRTPSDSATLERDQTALLVDGRASLLQSESSTRTSSTSNPPTRQRRLSSQALALFERIKALARRAPFERRPVSPPPPYEHRACCEGHEDMLFIDDEAERQNVCTNAGLIGNNDDDNRPKSRTIICEIHLRPHLATEQDSTLKGTPQQNQHHADTKFNSARKFSKTINLLEDTREDTSQLAMTTNKLLQLNDTRKHVEQARVQASAACGSMTIIAPPWSLSSQTESDGDLTTSSGSCSRLLDGSLATSHQDHDRVEVEYELTAMCDKPATGAHKRVSTRERDRGHQADCC